MNEAVILNSELVVNFTAYMCKKHRLKIRYKRESRFMKIVAWFMGKFSKFTEDEFLNETTTNLFKRLWLWFKLGVAKQFPLENQIAVIAHECQHDFQRDFFYPLRYVFSKNWRAIYEMEAYAVNMELAFWYTGKMLDPLYLAKRLFKYGCDEENVNDARVYLEMRRDRIKQGIIDTRAGKEAIGYFEVCALSLKGMGEAKYGRFL